MSVARTTYATTHLTHTHTPVSHDTLMLRPSRTISLGSGQVLHPVDYTLVSLITRPAARQSARAFALRVGTAHVARRSANEIIAKRDVHEEYLGPAISFMYASGQSVQAACSRSRVAGIGRSLVRFGFG